MNSETETPPAVVIDHGAGTFIKAGLAGYEAPSAKFLALVGKPAKAKTGFGLKDSYIGDEALTQPYGILDAYRGRPIDKGVVVHWGDMERIWHHIFYNELRVEPENQPVFLTENAFTPKSNRERSAQIMFETFKTPAIYVASRSVCSLSASSKAYGIVVDSGDEYTHITPIQDCQVVPNATLKMDIGGRHLTEYLIKMLSKRGHSFATTAERNTAKDIKEKFGYVALDFEQEMKSASSSICKSYKLPKGQEVTLGDESFKCAEPLFQPPLLGMGIPGLSQAITKTILESTDKLMKEKYYKGIVLAGGNTLFSGMTERLQKELTSLAPPATNISITATPERRDMAWIGGSILASLSMLPWISKQDYDESGASVVTKDFIS